MKELLHEYGFLIIAIVVIVGLITIVTIAKTNVQESANSTVTSLSTMSSNAMSKAQNDVTTNIENSNN